MPVKRRVGRPRKRTTLRGRGIKDWFKKAYSWAKDKASGLWNANKGLLRDKAIQLANQAKDKAIAYAQEKKILSNAVNKILPGRYGIDKIASDYVASKTGMGRRRRVGRPRKYGRGSSNLARYLTHPNGWAKSPPLRGRGFFGDLWSGVKNVGNLALPYVMPKILPKILPKVLPVLPKLLGVGKRRRVTRRVTRRKTGGAKKRVVHRRRRLTGRGILSGFISQMLPF